MSIVLLGLAGVLACPRQTEPSPFYQATKEIVLLLHAGRRGRLRSQHHGAQIKFHACFRKVVITDFLPQHLSPGCSLIEQHFRKDSSLLKNGETL